MSRDALGEDDAFHHDGDALGEAKDHVHVVLDDEHADVLGQGPDRVENDVALGAGYAGGGLVEQQYLRLQSERDRELDQALATIGQLGNALLRVVVRASSVSSRCIDSAITSLRRPAGCTIDGAAPSRSATAI